LAVLGVVRAGQTRIPASGSQQLGMRARLDDLPAREHRYLVGALDGREPVGDGDRRPAAGHDGQRRLELALGVVVQGAGGPVADEDAGVAQQGARDGEALLLATGEPPPARADDRVETTRERGDEVGDLGRLEHPPQLVVGLRPALRLSDLAERLRVAPRSATEVVDGLVERGLVTRGPDPSDRRAVLVDLTAAGHRTVTDIHRSQAAAADETFGSLSERDRAQLRRLLRRVVADEPPRE